VNGLETHQAVSKWKAAVKPALESKSDELRMLGYQEATGEDVWKCLEVKVWKGDPVMRVYEVVQDIFHLGSNIYMSYLTLDAYKDEDLMASIAALNASDSAEATLQ
jgi:hypothetical protein